MNDLLRALPEAQQRLLGVAPAAHESASDPMRAVLTDRREFGPGWLFERKLDGMRALATRDTDRVRLLSRTGRAVQASYPEIAEALAAQQSDGFTVDGEVVAFAHGRTDFSRLQQRMQLTDPRRARASGVAVTYYVFDLLRLDGIDLTRLPLRTRKSLLRRARLPPARALHPHRNQGGQQQLDEACTRGWEGLIAKRAESRYQRRRSPDWLKLKCANGQELVIGGFTEPATARTGFGALLLGYYDNGGFTYAGKVGTGFDHTTLARIRDGLDALETAASPFSTPVPNQGVHWVEPVLVAEIGFTEWTRDGMLRHPRFLGLRQDKEATDVVRERPHRTL